MPMLNSTNKPHITLENSRTTRNTLKFANTENAFSIKSYMLHWMVKGRSWGVDPYEQNCSSFDSD